MRSKARSTGTRTAGNRRSATRARRGASVAAAVLAAIAVAGCSDGNGGGAKASGTPPPVAPSATAGPDTAASTPPSDARESTPAASGSPRASSRPGTTGAPSSRPTTTKPRTSAPAEGGAGAAFQGTWYVPVRRGDGALGVLTVDGTAVSLTAGSTKCSGTLSATASVTLNCQGMTARGKAVVSGNGKTLTFDWTEGESDSFVRTKPA
ncbi:hypothetical protein OG948_41020 (plasmid) [Embleya sp. NBC_00888]|uniref:hypothetical protein n=1 Tax=Embleya sp. NBC_00888 TaxID=2975960 RepID=UPI002F913384|nr:hypothetical protein OG948_41020 [Embleya sp. NBC_00888]